MKLIYLIKTAKIGAALDVLLYEYDEYLQDRDAAMQALMRRRADPAFDLRPECGLVRGEVLFSAQSSLAGAYVPLVIEVSELCSEQFPAALEFFERVRASFLISGEAAALLLSPDAELSLLGLLLQSPWAALDEALLEPPHGDKRAVYPAPGQDTAEWLSGLEFAEDIPLL
ncbi:hypothetical protein ACFP81_00870 [Deinococcus lacus]|uniref:Uncharacterized protein n=1 Tax=Deinococcus lacus TaxID=392561 RepID=A0ABW1Y8V4_9DEIO